MTLPDGTPNPTGRNSVKQKRVQEKTPIQIEWSEIIDGLTKKLDSQPEKVEIMTIFNMLWFSYGPKENETDRRLIRERIDQITVEELQKLYRAKNIQTLFGDSPSYPSRSYFGSAKDAVKLFKRNTHSSELRQNAAYHVYKQFVKQLSNQYK